VSGSAAPTPGSGLVVLDKPAGMTSHDVVARVRRLAGTRRVGHAGTLDPMATGVLLLGLDKATRLLGHLTLTEKAYDGVVRLGVSTTTDDAEGEVVARASAADVAPEQVRSALRGFVGTIEQVPSAVSAVKVGGRRAYARVRAGETVELAPRPVTIRSLDVGAMHRDGEALDVAVSVRCSSGTYIRAIARDLGAALGVGGHLTALRRTAVGPFGLAESRTLEQLADSFDMVSLSEVAARCFPTFTVDEDGARDVSYGRRLALDVGAARPVAVLDEDGRFLALYGQQGPVAVPVAVFV
jgi:tRNA pseudouridine55 synthase